MKKCIEFNGVSKKYEVGEKAFYALDDVSFSIDQHEIPSLEVCTMNV